MKKILSVLLVLTMVLAFASTAMAATNYTAGDMIVLKRDANAYDAAKSSKKTKSVAAEGSTALVVKQCGDYVCRSSSTGAAPPPISGSAT